MEDLATATTAAAAAAAAAIPAGHVVFKFVRPETSPGEGRQTTAVIQVDTAVLSDASPYFRCVFAAEPDERVWILEESPAFMREIISILHSGPELYRGPCLPLSARTADHIINVCAVARRYNLFPRIQEAWGRVLYVTDNMTHEDLWKMAVAAYICQNQEVFRRATRKLLWERADDYMPLFLGRFQSPILHEQWPIMIKMAETRSTMHSVLSGHINRVMCDIWGRLHTEYSNRFIVRMHELESLSGGAKTALWTTILFFCWLQWLHQYTVSSKTVANKWALLNRLCGVQEVANGAGDKDGSRLWVDEQNTYPVPHIIRKQLWLRLQAFQRTFPGLTIIKPGQPDKK